jgi:hypothetical protein
VTKLNIRKNPLGSPATFCSAEDQQSVTNDKFFHLAPVWQAIWWRILSVSFPQFL